MTAIGVEAGFGGENGVIARWLRSLRAPSSVRTYLRSARRFTTHFLGAAAVVDDIVPSLASAGPLRVSEAVLAWRDRLAASGLSEGTVTSMVTAISSLVAFCRAEGLITWHLSRVQAKSVRSPRRRAKRADIERVLALVAGRAARIRPDRPFRWQQQALRDAAMLLTMYTVPLKRCQVGTVRWPEDVDLPAASLVVRSGGDTKTEILPSRCIEALRKWIHARGRDPGPLFPRADRSLKGGCSGITGEGVRRLLIRLCKDAGIKRAIAPDELFGTAEAAQSIGEGAAVTTFEESLDRLIAAVAPGSVDDTMRAKAAAVISILRRMLEESA